MIRAYENDCAELRLDKMGIWLDKLPPEKLIQGEELQQYDLPEHPPTAVARERTAPSLPEFERVLTAAMCIRKMVQRRRDLVRPMPQMQPVSFLFLQQMKLMTISRRRLINLRPSEHE